MRVDEPRDGSVLALAILRAFPISTAVTQSETRKQRRFLQQQPGRIGIAARLLTALAEADINVRMIDQGSSELNIIVGVEARDFETAVRAIYRTFVQD